MNHKRELTTDRLEECQRLNDLFRSKKKALRMSLQTVAEAGGITPTAVSHYLSGRNPLNIAFAALMSDLLDVPVEDFSPRLAKEMADIAGRVNRCAAKDLSGDSLHIPKLDLITGVKYLPHQTCAGITLTVSEVQSLARGSEIKNLAVVCCADDTMRPTFAAGDVVIVDRSVREVVNDGVYVAVVDGSFQIRRFQRVINGGYLMLSDNCVYPAQFIEPNRERQLFVAGKALSVLKIAHI